MNSHLETLVKAFGLTPKGLSPAPSGNINETYIVSTGAQRFVLQAVHPIFGPVVNDDILAVTKHLTKKGVPVPQLVLTSDGATSLTDNNGKVWRMMTFVSGETIFAVDSLERCGAAAAMLGRLHAALSDFKYEFKNKRGDVHVIENHIQTLHDALREHRDHVAFAKIEPLAREILESIAALPPAPLLPLRALHGDPKISNFLFSSPTTVSAVIDLDTFHRGRLDNELGDAFRSWCNPTSEDDPGASFSLEMYQAGFAAYAAEVKEIISPEELATVPVGIERISLELAARFCADALNESYFRWDRRKFSAAWEHNILRAQSQLSLAKSVHKKLNTA